MLMAWTAILIEKVDNADRISFFSVRTGIAFPTQGVVGRYLRSIGVIAIDRKVAERTHGVNLVDAQPCIRDHRYFRRHANDGGGGRRGTAQGADALRRERCRGRCWRYPEGPARRRCGTQMVERQTDGAAPAWLRHRGESVSAGTCRDVLQGDHSRSLPRGSTRARAGTPSPGPLSRGTSIVCTR